MVVKCTHKLTIHTSQDTELVQADLTNSDFLHWRANLLADR